MGWCQGIDAGGLFGLILQIEVFHMGKRNRNATNTKEFNGQLFNAFNDELTLERATGASPLKLEFCGRLELRFAGEDGTRRSLFDKGNDFWQAAKLWTRRRPAREAERCVLATQPEAYGTLNGFRLYRPVEPKTEEVAMLCELRDIVQRARPGEIKIESRLTREVVWTEQPFVVTTWPIAVIAAAQQLMPLDRLLVPAGPVLDKEQKYAIHYQGLVLAQDLLACWQQA